MLAERGVARLTLLEDGQQRTLEARRTDLPRILFAASPGSRLTWDGGAAIREGEGWRVDAGPDIAGHG